MPDPYRNGMSITSDREQLAKIERQIAEIADTGQSYSLVGGHAVTHAPLHELRILANSLRARILRRKGCSGRIA